MKETKADLEATKAELDTLRVAQEGCSAQAAQVADAQKEAREAAMIEYKNFDKFKWEMAPKVVGFF